MAKSTKGCQPALSVTHKTTPSFESKAKRLELNLKASLAQKLRDDLLRMKTEEMHVDLQLVGGSYQTGGHRIILKCRTHGKIPEKLFDTASGSQPIIPVNFDTPDDIQQFTEMLYTFEEVDSEFVLGHLKKASGKDRSEMDYETEKHVLHTHKKEKKKLEQYSYETSQNEFTDVLKPVVSNNVGRLLSASTGVLKPVAMEDIGELISVSTDVPKPVAIENSEGLLSASAVCLAQKSVDTDDPPQNVCQPFETDYLNETHGKPDISCLQTFHQTQNILTKVQGDCDVMSLCVSLSDVSSCSGGEDSSVTGTADDPAWLGAESFCVQPLPTDEKVFPKFHSQSLHNGGQDDEDVQRGEEVTLAKSVTKGKHTKDRCGKLVAAEAGLAGQPVSRLASDLLWFYLEGSDADCCLLVDGKRYPAHKCLLAARCQYFDGMFSGNWSEWKEVEVDLQGVTASAVSYLLQYIYGAMVEVPTSDIESVVQAADMFGLEDLKELLAFQITKNLCHFFHKPCQICAGSVSSVLLLATSYNLDKLFKQCLDWTAKYFRRIFEVPAFGTIAASLLEDCTKMIVQQMNVETVTQVVLDAHDLIRCLQQTRRAELLQGAATIILDAAVAFSAENFPAVVNASGFVSWSKGGAWSVGVLEEAYTTAVSLMQPETACDAYISVRNLLTKTEAQAQKTDLASPGCDELKGLLHKLVERCEWYFHRYIHRVMQCPGWLTLPADLQQDLLHKSSFVPVHLPASSACQSVVARRSARALQENIVNTVQVLRDIDPALFPSVTQPPRQMCAGVGQTVTRCSENKTEFSGKNGEQISIEKARTCHLSARKKDRMQGPKSALRPVAMDSLRMTRTSARSHSVQTSQPELRSCDHSPSPSNRHKSLEKKSESAPDATQGIWTAKALSSRKERTDSLRLSRPSSQSSRIASVSTKVGEACGSLTKGRVSTPRDVCQTKGRVSTPRDVCHTMCTSMPLTLKDPPSSTTEDSAQSRLEALTCQRQAGGLAETGACSQSKLTECKKEAVGFHGRCHPDVMTAASHSECVVVPLEQKLNVTFNVPSD